MISIHSLEQIETPAPACDPKVSRVMDFATFLHARHDPATGETVTFWQLRKPLGVYPAGTALTLERLHRLLFATP